MMLNSVVSAVLIASACEWESRWRELREEKTDGAAVYKDLRS